VRKLLMITMLVLAVEPDVRADWQVRLELIPGRAMQVAPPLESPEARREREAHLTAARRRRRGPLAVAAVGGILWASGLMLVLLVGPIKQSRTTTIDPLSGARSSEAAYGISNWIEFGIGGALTVAGWPMWGAELHELSLLDDEVARYAKPPEPKGAVLSLPVIRF
jgi:hypothetical protein